MTREQIETQLRSDNPTTTDERGNRHGPGSEVYEAAIARWADAMEQAQQKPLPDATMIQVQVWLSRKGINPETIPQLIEQLTEDGPARWEALARWKTNPPVPADFPMVQILWQHIGPSLEITFEQAWEEILAI